METQDKNQNLVWIDMEMSGLDAQRDEILEIATIVTDENLNIVAQGPEIVIHHEASLFDSMDEWNQTHHTKSGLWQKVLESKTTTEEAEQQTLGFIKKHCAPKASPLCGNSIAQDKMFMLRHMPKLAQYLHYRLIDVSTIKELTNRWYKNGPKAAPKKNNHRALDDILESIRELQFYRDNFFTPLESNEK